MKHISKLILLLLIVGLAISACSDKDSDAYVPITDLTISPDFDWQSSRQVKVNIQLNSYEEVPKPLEGVVFELFAEKPTTLSTPLAKGITLEDGCYETYLHLPDSMNRLWARGFMGVHEIYVSNNEANLIIGETGAEESYSPYDGNYMRPNSKDWNTLPGYTYNYYGRPFPRTQTHFDSDFFNRLNATLPEGMELPSSHPHYMETTNSVNLNLIEDADVWVTFVHEGADYLNSLGFYQYDTDDQPQNTTEISDHTIFMPNASLNGSGGQMRAGDTIKLGQFNAGTTIAWFMVSNGFVPGYPPRVNTTAPVYYSDPHLNPEPNEDLRKHSVMVFDEVSQTFVVGFEDLPRLDESDDDFNDVVFMLTVNPLSAVDMGITPPIDIPQDSDHDGISDLFDDYPHDSDLAFNNYTFGPDAWGTLAFEDLWPDRGDYDFNDMIVDYNYNQITQIGNRVKKVEMNYKLRAIGARKANGFAVQTPFASSNIIALEASHPTLIEHESDGSTGVLRFFNSAFDLIPQQPDAFINTEISETHHLPVQFSVSFMLNSPINIVNIDPDPPYNPFIFVDRTRSHEIHLPGFQPTTRMNMELFNTGNDASTEGNWYKSTDNLPWAVNIPESWDYPIEKAQITQAYTKFKHWAQSSGASYPDWYKAISDFRNYDFIYQID